MTVACKLPNGLTFTHNDKTVTLNGANDSGNRFGYGFTEGVDEVFADFAATDGKDLPAIANGSIFIGGPDAARERMYDPRVQTGQEPLSPENPGEGVQPTDETKAALAGNGEGPPVNQAELESAATRSSKTK